MVRKIAFILRQFNIIAISCLFVLTVPCVVYSLTLPSLPSLPSGDASEAGGIIAPDAAIEETDTARPKETQDGPGDSAGMARENKYKINHQSIGSRIDQKMGKKDSRLTAPQSVEEGAETGDGIPVETPAAPAGGNSPKVKKPGFGFGFYLRSRE